MLSEVVQAIFIIYLIRYVIHFYQEYEANNIICQHQEWKKKHLDKKFIKPLKKRENKLILVTGGCGNLGSSMIELLLRRFPAAKIISLDLITRPSTERVTYVSGNISNISSIFEYFKGVDAVFHTAALVDIDSLRTKLLGVNLIGTQNIVECCIENDVGVLVHTSSISATMPKGVQNDYDESAKYNTIEAYGEAKRYAEELVLEANGIKGLYTTTFITIGIWGPYDPLGVRQIVGMKDAMYTMPSIDNDAQSSCFSENVCHGQILGLEKIEKSNGNRYFISDNKPIKQIDFRVQIWKEYHQKEIKFQEVPTVVFVGAAYLGSHFKWLLQPIYDLKVPMTKSMLIYAKELTFNISKLRNELGYEPLYTFDEAVKHAIKLYRIRYDSK
eukprot:gene11773-5111_t